VAMTKEHYRVKNSSGKGKEGNSSNMVHQKTPATRHAESEGMGWEPSARLG